MPIQIQCPGCRATLQVDDALAGMQGRCIHCGQRLVVPAKGGQAVALPTPPAAGTGRAAPTPGAGDAQAASPAAANQPAMPPAASAPAAATTNPPTSPPPAGKPSMSGIGSLSPTLFEATPESMTRELFRRQLSAMLLVFKPTAEGSYDLADVADSDLKCIVTEDLNPARFAQLVASFTKRFAPRKKGPGGSSPALEEQLYELKGDRLGMSLDEFKQKYARSVEGNPTRLPLCSDTAWGANKAALRSEPWHRNAGIVHARIDLPAEDNSPTVAGVKTEILLYQFVDGRLFGILAEFPTDLFHLVSEAAIKKYGPVTRENQKPRQLIWDNPAASIVLTRGSVHPVQASTLYLEHKQLTVLAASRTPTGVADI